MKFDNSYKSELNQHSLPVDLKEKTIALMKKAQEEKEDEETERIRVRKKPVYWRMAFAASAAVIIFVVALQFFNSGQIKIINNLQDNVHVAMVELSDGELNFYENNSLKIEIMDKFGGLNMSEGISIGDANSFSNRFLIPETPNGSDETLADYKIIKEDDAEKRFYNIIFESRESDASIQIFATEMQMKNTIETNSTVKNIPMFLEWTEKTKEYTAEFILNNIYYNITSKQLTQKEFIEFLINFMK